MGSASSNVSSIQQSFMTNITQANQLTCQAQSTPTQDNNFVAVSGTTVQGNFVGVGTCANTDASCLIVSNMNNSITNILTASLSQNNQTETDWFNGFQFTADTNYFDMNQSVTNNINQINQSTCAANSAPDLSNNYIYVANTKVKGNFVGVGSKSNASANCSMTNTMKNNTYNQAQADANQSNVIKGMFVSMVGAFTTMIIIIVIAVVILFSITAIAKVGYSKTSKSGAAKPLTLEQQLLAAESLDLSSVPPAEMSPTMAPTISPTITPTMASTSPSTFETFGNLASQFGQSDIGKSLSSSLSSSFQSYSSDVSKSLAASTKAKIK